MTTTQLQRVRRRRPTPSTPILHEYQPHTSPERLYRGALVAAVLLGAAVRAYHVLSHGFPLNDGGLFFSMVRDLQAAHYRLPAFTSYNDAGIPYAYSPLGFYLAALVNEWTPLTLVDVFRWLPLIASVLTLVAFADLARRLLASRTAVVTAVVAFALIPRSFIWTLMGGGLTRSLGFLFALVSVRLLYAVYTQRRWRDVLLLSIAAAATVLSHLGTAPFVAFTGVLFMLAYGRDRRALGMSLAAAAVALILTAPWWLTVVRMHGFGPFLAASATGGSIFHSLSLREAVATLAQMGLGTAESVLAVIGMLGALGFFYSLAMRDWLLPAWWIAIVTLDARQGSTFSTVPIALLAGVAVAHLLLPAMRAARASTLRRSPGRAGWSPELVLGLLAVFATVSALIRTPIPGGVGDMGALSPQELAAFRWVQGRTSPKARFLVVSGTPWEIDRTSEWLPVLTGRKSVATVQGYEWRPIGQFIRKKREYNDLQGCASWVAQCLQDWASATGQWYTYVYIPKSPDRDCCRQLRYSLERDPGFRLVYNGRGAELFVRSMSHPLAVR